VTLRAQSGVALGHPLVSPIFWTLAVIVIAVIVCGILVAVSPAESIYDETWYLATIPLLHRFGLSLAFLTSLPGPAGPTYTLTYAAVETVFGLHMPWLRFTGLALLMLSSLLLMSAFLTMPRFERTCLPASAFLLGALIIPLPLVGVSACMALTEMPAFFFICLFLCILLWSLPRRDSNNYGSIFGGVVAGLALGLAILGRQNYLVVLVCLPLLVRQREETPSWDNAFFVSSVFLAALLLVAPVFIAWNGLVPPGMASMGHGFSIRNALFGAGYAAVIVLILAPQIYRRLAERPYGLAAIALAGMSFVLLQDVEQLPAHSVLGQLSPQWASAVGIAFAAFLATMGLATILALILHLVASFDRLIIRFSTSVALLGLLSNAKITHQFSSRYVFVFIPFLLLALAYDVRPTGQLPARLAVGGLLSAMSLAGYFNLI